MIAGIILSISQLSDKQRCRPRLDEADSPGGLDEVSLSRAMTGEVKEPRPLPTPPDACVVTTVSDQRRLHFHVSSGETPALMSVMSRRTWNYQGPNGDQEILSPLSRG